MPWKNPKTDKMQQILSCPGLGKLRRWKKIPLIQGFYVLAHEGC